MRLVKRFTAVLTLILIVSGALAPQALGFGTKVVGKPKNFTPRPTLPEEREPEHEGPDGPLAAVTITGGPADETCIQPGGRAPSESVEWEPPVPPDVIYTPVYGWRDVIGADPPRQEWVEVGSDRVVIRRWKVLTLVCNGQPRQVRVCVPGPGQPDTVCPPVEKPDGRAVALHSVRYLDWRDLNPLFAPDITSEGIGSYALTQAPTFFWFSAEDWNHHPSAEARACTQAGCLTATTTAIPIGVGFVPGVGRDEAKCIASRGTEIGSPSAYEAARKSRVCNQYTYKHSSTTVGGSYSASVYMDYQIWIGSEDESDPRRNVPFGPDPGNIRESSVAFELRVGEIEGVKR